MTTGTRQITRELKARREALLSAYDDEDLHQLRVNIRRVRALLKHQPGKQAKTLRRAFGRLAASTNAARDWDTFGTWASEKLPDPQWRELRPLLAEYRGRARGRVAGILESTDWDLTLQQWEALATKGASQRSGGVEEKTGRDGLEAAERARQAGHRALSWDDEESWHRFRIAIKNLRYTLDNTDITSKTRRKPVKATLKLCKRLQNELGDWHDTVVHRGLLAQLAEDPAVLENPGLAAVLDTLGAAIHIRGNDRLLCVRQIMDHQSWLLAAAAGSEAHGS